MMKEHIELIKKKVKEAKQIVIISHISPDGDAVGSSLGLYHFLKNHCSNTQVVLPNAFPSFLNWLPNSDEIVLFEKNQVKDIKLYVEPKSMVYPMKSAKHESLKVKGFIWNFDSKPQDKDDL